jgi:hypothetical protein
MPSVATHFTCHARVMNVHNLFLLISPIFELLHQQVHLGRQHVYLLELMHTSTSLASLSTFFILVLVGDHLLYKSGCVSDGE